MFCRFHKASVVMFNVRALMSQVQPLTSVFRLSLELKDCAELQIQLSQCNE